MDCIALIALFYAHYIGDWKFQPREMALAKSEKFSVLMKHVGIVSACLFFPLFVFFSLSSFSLITGIWAALVFIVINGVHHALTDWNVWRGYKQKVMDRLGGDEEALKAFVDNREYAEDKEYIDTIGWDGLLHYTALIALFFLFRMFV